MSFVVTSNRILCRIKSTLAAGLRFRLYLFFFDFFLWFCFEFFLPIHRAHSTVLRPGTDDDDDDDETLRLPFALLLVRYGHNDSRRFRITPQPKYSERAITEDKFHTRTNTEARGIDGEIRITYQDKSVRGNNREERGRDEESKNKIKRVCSILKYEMSDIFFCIKSSNPLLFNFKCNFVTFFFWNI